jgi:hypothetical protein
MACTGSRLCPIALVLATGDPVPPSIIPLHALLSVATQHWNKGTSHLLCVTVAGLSAVVQQLTCMLGWCPRKRMPVPWGCPARKACCASMWWQSRAELPAHMQHDVAHAQHILYNAIPDITKAGHTQMVPIQMCMHAAQHCKYPCGTRKRCNPRAQPPATYKAMSLDTP